MTDYKIIVFMNSHYMASQVSSKHWTAFEATHSSKVRSILRDSLNVKADIKQTNILTTSGDVFPFTLDMFVGKE